MVCDIDDFKNVNDTLGHITGDKVLKSISGRLNKMMRGGDTLARAGGDEFVILLSEISTEEEAETVARRIEIAFTKPFTIDSKEINTSFSIGIAIYPDNGKKIWALLNKADSAMYQVKSEGGKGCHIFKEI
jgi:diguanylate cyclase (GGDEF)-like protein